MSNQAFIVCKHLFERVIGSVQLYGEDDSFRISGALVQSRRTVYITEVASNDKIKLKSSWLENDLDVLCIVRWTEEYYMLYVLSVAEFKEKIKKLCKAKPKEVDGSMIYVKYSDFTWRQHSALTFFNVLYDTQGIPEVERARIIQDWCKEVEEA
jgi:hypothetical protein